MFINDNLLILLQYNLTSLMNIDKSDKYHMIFELADGGTLREHLEKRFEDLTWKDKYKLGLDITCFKTLDKPKSVIFATPDLIRILLED